MERPATNDFPGSAMLIEDNARTLGKHNVQPNAYGLRKRSRLWVSINPSYLRTEVPDKPSRLDVAERVAPLTQPCRQRMQLDAKNVSDLLFSE